MNRTALFLAALLLATGVFAHLLTPTKKLADTSQKFELETMIPMEFGEWRVDKSMIPIIPSPDVQANLEMTYDMLVSRTYINRSGERIMLSITYGSAQNKKHQSHRQEICYSAQGFTIEELQHLTIPVFNSIIPATRMLAVQGRRSEPVTYWFTMGDQVVLSRFERQWVQLKYALVGVVPDGYMVRISNLSKDSAKSFKDHITFAEELLTAMDADLVDRLLGRKPKGN